MDGPCHSRLEVMGTGPNPIPGEGRGQRLWARLKWMEGKAGAQGEPGVPTHRKALGLTTS